MAIDVDIGESLSEKHFEQTNPCVKFSIVISAALYPRGNHIGFGFKFTHRIALPKHRKINTANPWDGLHFVLRIYQIEIEE